MEKDIVVIFEDSLRAKKFDCLDSKSSSNLYTQKWGDFLGAHDPKRAKELAENASKDKQYINREIENATPYLQNVSISGCFKGNSCVLIKRFNFPNAKKRRHWEFKYEESESINHLVSRMIDSLTNNKPSK